jgi:hypothetical protein
VAMAHIMGRNTEEEVTLGRRWGQLRLLGGEAELSEEGVVVVWWL